MAAGLYKRRPLWRARRSSHSIASEIAAPIATPVAAPPTVRLVHVPLVEPVYANGGATSVGVKGATAQRKHRPVWGVVKWPLMVAGLLVFGYIGWVAYSFAALQGEIYEPLPPTPTKDVASERATSTAIAAQGIEEEPEPTPDLTLILPQGRINILVMGTDKRENDNDHTARSDTILLVNLDTISRTARLMTIPRDLVVDVPGYGKNKVNSAFLFGEYYKLPGGGKALTVRTVSEFFDVPIDYYVTVNFQGFRQLVDTLGGVNINVPYEIDDPLYPSDDEGDPFGFRHVHFDVGWQHMDGKTALRYARTRHADNDFMRSKRQLQVIMAMREKALSTDLIPRLPSILNQLGGMIETNIPFEEQLGLAQLGYGIEPSNIITSTIDSRMVTVMWLPDGSEGLRLNWKVAQPMLNEFFGWSQSGALGSPTPALGASQSGADGWPSSKATATRTPSRRATQSPTRTVRPVPSRSPTRAPTATPRRARGALPGGNAVASDASNDLASAP